MIDGRIIRLRAGTVSPGISVLLEVLFLSTGAATNQQSVSLYKFHRHLVLSLCCWLCCPARCRKYKASLCKAAMFFCSSVQLPACTPRAYHAGSSVDVGNESCPQSPLTRAAVHAQPTTVSQSLIIVISDGRNTQLFVLFR